MRAHAAAAMMAGLTGVSSLVSGSPLAHTGPPSHGPAPRADLTSPPASQDRGGLPYSPASSATRLPVLYTVRAGDTLAKIAAARLGSAGRWPDLWWWNRDKITNPDVITTGMTLVIYRWRPPYASWEPYVTAQALAAIPKPPPPPPPAAAPGQASPAQAAAPAAQPQGGQVATGTSVYGVPAWASQCIISHESGGNPGAYNPSSGAGGLVQFLPSTWASTPYGAEYPGGAQTAPASVQMEAFAWEWAQVGMSAWGPYDGC